MAGVNAICKDKPGNDCLEKAIQDMVYSTGENKARMLAYQNCSSKCGDLIPPRHQWKLTKTSDIGNELSLGSILINRQYVDFI